MSTVAGLRWQLSKEPPEEARCLLCGDGTPPLVDLALEREGERLFLCPECVTGLARTARVGSKAAEALRLEYQAEIAERDERLRSMADELRESERRFAEVREQSSEAQQRLSDAQILASQAVGVLQRIGQ
jgi:hypothetical protein